MSQIQIAWPELFMLTACISTALCVTFVLWLEICQQKMKATRHVELVLMYEGALHILCPFKLLFNGVEQVNSS